MSRHDDLRELSAAVDRELAEGERGSALVLALFLVVILSVMGFGLLTRALMVTRIAGSERWVTKTFYAADAGLNLARARVRVNQTGGFQFTMDDLRGPSASRRVAAIDVQVDPMTTVGTPRLAVGTQISGGQGGAEGLYILFYATESRGDETLTRSASVVSSVLTVGPVPLTIPTE